MTGAPTLVVGTKARPMDTDSAPALRVRGIMRVPGPTASKLVVCTHGRLVVLMKDSGVMERDMDLE